jgi:hypothetical protein
MSGPTHDFFHSICISNGFNIIDYKHVFINGICVTECKVSSFLHNNYRMGVGYDENCGLSAKKAREIVMKQLDVDKHISIPKSQHKSKNNYPLHKNHKKFMNRNKYKNNLRESAFISPVKFGSITPEKDYCVIFRGINEAQIVTKTLRYCMEYGSVVDYKYMVNDLELWVWMENDETTQKIINDGNYRGKVFLGCTSLKQHQEERLKSMRTFFTKKDTPI